MKKAGLGILCLLVLSTCLSILSPIDNVYAQISGTEGRYKAVCSFCGKEFEVPFKPDPNRPIYCYDCWRALREGVRVSCSVSKDTITRGDNIIVSGSSSIAVSGKTVILTYVRPDGSTLNRTVISDSDGNYSDSYIPDMTGSWSVTALWIGNAFGYNKKSDSKPFMVTTKSFIETPLGMVTTIATVSGIVIVVLVLRKVVRVKERV